MGPVSFLLVAGALGAALTLTTLYSTSYAVIVDGQEVGIVADQSVVDQAIQTVETRGSQLLGYDYKVDSHIDYSFTLTLKSDLSREQDISNYFYGQLNELSDQLRLTDHAGRAYHRRHQRRGRPERRAGRHQGRICNRRHHFRRICGGRIHYPRLCCGRLDERQPD